MILLMLGVVILMAALCIWGSVSFTDGMVLFGRWLFIFSAACALVVLTKEVIA